MPDGSERSHPRAALLAIALSFIAGALFGAGPPQPSTPASKGAEPAPLPKFEQIEALVHKEFAKRSGYRPGDLLARGDASGLFPELEKLGWKVSDHGSLEDRLLPDSDVVARELRAANARNFMRHVSKIPEGFDRVDRLRRMPNGQQRLQELIRGPDGHLLIQYLATTPNGRRTGSSIAHGENGRDFNRRTGRLYTETQWVEALREVHTRDVATHTKAGAKK